MRLIDADMLKKYMMDNGKETERFLRCIDEQPTAYDTNKVIEELTTAIDIVKGGVRPGGNVSSTPWIFVSERLPKNPEIDGDSDGYIVQTRRVAQPFIGYWDGIDFTDGWRSLDVIAWMPLPEPYREVE